MYQEPGANLVKVRDLTRLGLLNRILEYDESRSLYFTHQSFQEFMAATFLSRTSDPVEFLAGNPDLTRWLEVAKFTAGILGASFITKLANHPSFSATHLHILLRAYCALEVTNLPAETRTSIANDLDRLVNGGLFGDRALALMCKLSPNDAQFLRSIRLEMLEDYLEKNPPDTLSTVQQAALLKRLLFENPTSTKYIRCIERIAPAITAPLEDDCLQILCEEVLSQESRFRKVAAKVLAAVAGVLSDAQVATLLHLALRSDVLERNLSFHFLAVIGGRLTASQLAEILIQTQAPLTTTKTLTLNALSRARIIQTRDGVEALLPLLNDEIPLFARVPYWPSRLRRIV